MDKRQLHARNLNPSRGTISDTGKGVAPDNHVPGHGRTNVSKFAPLDLPEVVEPVATKISKQAAAVVKKALRSLPASSLIELRKCKEAGLVSLGDEDSGVYMFYVDADTDGSTKRALADELELAAKRLKVEADKSDGNESPADV